MSYTREQRAANAAKAAAAAATETPAAAPTEPQTEQPSAAEEKPEVTRNLKVGNPDRDGAMEQFYARRDKEREAEPAPEAQQAEQQSEQPAQDAPAAAEQAAEQKPETPKTSKQVVDGKDYEVPLQEIEDAGGERAWRINRAAQNRLDEAKQALAESKRIQAETLARSAPPKAPEPTDKDFMASAMQKVRFGSDEESAAAMAEILARQARRSPDPSIITNQAVIQMKRSAAVDAFKAEFPDIVSNPVLGKLALALETEELQKLPHSFISDPQSMQFDWHGVYRKIGATIQGAVGKPAAAASTAPGTAAPAIAPSKQERKENIVNIRSAGARAALPEEAKPETRESVLAGIRKARGQAE